jgi:hypothetical protein
VTGNLNAQEKITNSNFVTIPDTNFVKFLQIEYSSCMSGNQLDTSCSIVKMAKQLQPTNRSIRDLTGVQYFPNLTHLYCNDNLLESIPELNCPNLIIYNCSNNKLTALPPINSTKLAWFNCSQNQLTALPALNSFELLEIECQNNLLTTLPAFNLPKLTKLICNNNHIKSLPVLNLPKMTEFNCESNELTELVNLNGHELWKLNCNKNALTTLSLNYPNLGYLLCADNQLTALPSLPVGLCSLICSNNKLTALPALPAQFECGLECENNKISCFPLFPDSLRHINLAGNTFTCLPNYIESMNSTLLTYPICKDGDLVNNPNQCSHVAEIMGLVFKDNDSNCMLTSGDDYISGRIQWYDDKNNLIGRTFSSSIYEYKLKVASGGVYKVRLDTADMPYKTTCPMEQVVNLKNGASGKNINFGVNCKPGVDLSVDGIGHHGLVFPGQKHDMIVIAGDRSRLYGMNCAAGASGQVKVTVSGPVDYAGIPSGALTPTISGNVFTYTIADFGVVLQDGIRLSFITRTTATANDSICIHAQVILNGTDVNMANNSIDYCYRVVNSHDPNIKEVYPLNIVDEGYKGWFTYTIHFQNTGNASALNIRLADTLDKNLDLKTLEIVNFSHRYETTLTGNVLDVRFPWINLADSASYPEFSTGFIQYRIKPKPNLQAGTVIKNNAFIYFDYNPPIVTNTTMNKYVKFVSVDENDRKSFMHVYPNPGNGHYFMEFNEETANAGLIIEVYNLLGSVVYTGKTRVALTSVDLSHEPNGVYFIKVSGAGQSFNQRLIKQ